MRIRQAEKLLNNAHGKPTGKIIKALRTIWHRTRHAEGLSVAGNRMGGSVSDKTVSVVAKILTEEIKV